MFCLKCTQKVVTKMINSINGSKTFDKACVTSPFLLHPPIFVFLLYIHYLKVFYPVKKIIRTFLKISEDFKKIVTKLKYFCIFDKIVP